MPTFITIYRDIFFAVYFYFFLFFRQSIPIELSICLFTKNEKIIVNGKLTQQQQQQHLHDTLNAFSDQIAHRYLDGSFVMDAIFCLLCHQPYDYRHL